MLNYAHINIFITLEKQTFFHFAVWKKWEVQSSSFMQRMITWFHFLLSRRYFSPSATEKIFSCNHKWWSLIFWCSFLFQANSTYFALLFQLYEVAVSAQNAERVKLEPFDGSKGYLHNGLYRDPKLPGILMWEYISLMILKDIVLCCPNQCMLN